MPALALLLVLLGCQAPRPSPEAAPATAGLVDLLGEALEAAYRVRAAVEDAGEAGEGERLAREAEAARRRLAEGLVAARLLPAEGMATLDLPQAIRVLRGPLVSRGDLVFLPTRTPGGVEGVRLVHAVRREVDLRSPLPWLEVPYNLIEFDRTEIPDYALWRARAAGRADGGTFLPSHIVGRDLYVDLEVVRRVGRERFIPEAGRYRGLDAEVAGGLLGSLVPGDPATFYQTLKDVLRWRSLDHVYAGALEGDAGVEDRFVEAWLASERDREVATICFGERMPEDSETVAVLALWSQACRYPEAGLANAVALYLQRLAGIDNPQTRAAGGVIAILVGLLSPGAVDLPEGPPRREVLVGLVGVSLEEVQGWARAQVATALASGE